MKTQRAISVIIFLVCSCAAQAQSFTVLTDTFYLTGTSHTTLNHDSVVTGQGPITFLWQVEACNFPTDWIDSGAFSLCDNSYCRYLWSVWPSGGSESTFQYAARDTGVLTLVMDLPISATAGCYYLTLRLRNMYSYSNSVRETWMICNNATLAVPGGSESLGICLYPDPARDELHIHCDAGAEVGVYNSLGQRLKLFNAVSENTTIGLADLIPGLYTARIVEAGGTKITVKNFVKE